MRKLLTLLLGAALLAALGAAPAAAAVPSLAHVVANQPGATLLLPYFEVNLADDTGVDTVFSVNNASATAILAHATVWSDLAVPVFTFDIYLTGFDVQYVSMRKLFKGQLPRTASDGQDSTDTISHQGIVSQDINFASCAGFLPPAPIPAGQLSGIRAALTGRSSSLFGGDCAGVNYGDRKARGFVTIDTVTQCTTANPSDAGYFAGIASYQNVMWGEFFYLRAFTPSTPAPQHVGAPLVAVRSSYTDPQTTVAGEYTFYARLVGSNASDKRQPLGSAFAARYIRGRSFSTTPALVVWRDPKVDQGPFSCGAYPSWYGLGMEDLVAFDERENPTDLDGSAAFPAAAQRKLVSALMAPTPAGWLYLNLNTAVVGATDPVEDPAAAQAWVTVIEDAKGRFSLAHPATMMESAAEATHFQIMP